MYDSTQLAWHPATYLGGPAVAGYAAITTLGDVAAGLPHLFPVEIDEDRFIDFDRGHSAERVDVFNGCLYYRARQGTDDSWHRVDVVLGRTDGPGGPGGPGDGFG